ncbi:DUF2062 domain-containing protein [Persicobacter psychrovividus]|uniref:DUF2062 domain-containing protein n=1 Tax=Persicobacter psychrovividus TaxID=387638 RepID=A0ABN6LBA5_9BACT|nr:hypothetical protein PEPS_27610 [Persicobacter psychrovividus]
MNKTSKHSWWAKQWLKIKSLDLKEILLAPNEPLWKKGLAVALGVIIGVLPLWGFQTVIALGSSRVFKLNSPLVVLGSYINFTPLLPVLIYYALKVGFFFQGQPMPFKNFTEISIATAQSSFLAYLIGAIPVAILSGIFFGAILVILLGAQRVIFKKPTSSIQK